LARRDPKPWIGKLSQSKQISIVERVCRRLQDRYGLPRHGNPDNSLDDLVYIIVSNRTRIETAMEGFDLLKRTVPRWDDVLKDPSQVKRILQPLGLSNKKTDQILGILTVLRKDFGLATLEPIRGRSEEWVEKYLTSLPGVSLKVAKCVMMYTLGFQVLPVDTHVHRIATRLGWVDWKRADQSHADLEKLVPPTLRYAFHVDAVAHGQSVCRPLNPHCSICPITSDCRYASQKDISVC